MSYVQSIKLQSFRNHVDYDLSGLATGFIFITGPNGAGKTNILEAISLLTVGRGLRKAKTRDIQCTNDNRPWAVSSHVSTAFGNVPIGTGIDPTNDKRLVRIHGQSAKSQSELAEYMSVIWLTPQMDHLFIGGASDRRRFVDRLIVAYDPSHAGRLTRYENAMSQRSKLLKDGKGDPAWLNGLEQQMAETGVAIAASRLEFVQKWQAALDNLQNDDFPSTNVTMAGMVEEGLQNQPALSIEDGLKEQLYAFRQNDAVTGGAGVGPHKSDMAVVFRNKNMPAESCSTGEQKSLLINLIMGHSSLLAKDRDMPAVLLLDEVAAHLDENRRKGLFGLLQDLGGQVWVTGTDSAIFSDFEGQFLSLGS